jgi:glycogen debranching enzyme
MHPRFVQAEPAGHHDIGVGNEVRYEKCRFLSPGHFFQLVLAILGLLGTLPSLPAASAEPELKFAAQPLQNTLGEAYRQALHNLLGTNTIPADLKKHNRTGFLTGDSPKLIRAGGNYQDPWTRDASVNSWNAASLLCPEVARNTLWAVCERLPDGRLTIQRDNQWWDKLIWITAAWNHYATTGDTRFLNSACEAAESSLEEMRKTRFDQEFGLYQGPSHLADGIAGYPEPFDDPKGASSFILDHPGADKMMTLSANCIAYHGLRCAAKMAAAANRPRAIATAWNQQADQLKAAIQRHLWMADRGSFAYFLHGAGTLRGQQAKYQEATGLSLAILFDVADATQARAILQNARTTRYGIPLVDPEFSRYSAEKPGRHGRIIWPMAMGYWATAAAKAGRGDLFAQETTALAGLVRDSGWNFLEIYHPATGKPDGGWQCGFQWSSCQHQTWSATAFIRIIHQGLLGISFEPRGLVLAPTLPPSWGNVSLEGLRYRGMTLDFYVSGKGSRIARFSLDGKAGTVARVPSELTGRHRIELKMSE